MASPPMLRVGTRGSRLALAQARIVVDALRAARVAREVEIVPIRTRGDEVSEQRPRGGWEETDGQFTNELESALLAKTIDVAVHSHKDLPTAARAGVVIAAILERGDARDCLVSPDGGIEGLRTNARIGTSSVRRAVQLRALRGDLEIEPIRGNIDTRLRRLADGEYHGLLLALAGLDRLETATGQLHALDFDEMLPAPAQGALAIQARTRDDELVAALGELDHAPTRTAVTAERDLLRELGGGCLAPLGTYAELANGRLRLRAVFATEAGTLRRADVAGAPESARELVAQAAWLLTSREAATAVS